MLPNLLNSFHHTRECVKTLDLLQDTILKLVTTIDIFWTERLLVFTRNRYLSQSTKQHSSPFEVPELCFYLAGM